MRNDFDFDTPLPFDDLPSSKHGGMDRAFGTDCTGVTPMWVADMDFRAAPCITEALRREIETGYHGYWGSTTATADVVSGWYARRHGWRPDPRHVRFTHGVIGGLGCAVDAFTGPGDEIILFAPVYHAFYRQIEAQDRRVLEAGLRLEKGRFEIDWHALETLAARSVMMILCTPHNPGGRIWDAREVARLADVCARHGLILVSDEIHMDLTFPGAAHVPAATAAPDHLDRLIVLTAASKAFNVAGGETGIAIIPDDDLRRAFDASFLDRESSPNRYGIAMLHAAFSEGDDWLDAVRAYIARNFAILRDRLGALPGVRVMEMEATYLAWVDFRGTGMSHDELMERLLGQARVAPSPGPQFGSGGEGWMRFNVALPRATLEGALDRIEAAFSDLQ